jgi:hypothetical protein
MKKPRFRGGQPLRIGVDSTGPFGLSDYCTACGGMEANFYQLQLAHVVQLGHVVPF